MTLGEDGRYRVRVGREGESAAVKFLKRKGYVILERNYRAERGEIDIVARYRNTIVFVEVKTKKRQGFGEPEDWVDQKKQNQIGKVALGYLHEKQLDDVSCRFDVITVVFKNRKETIKHIEDAFWLQS